MPIEHKVFANKRYYLTDYATNKNAAMRKAAVYRRSGLLSRVSPSPAGSHGFYDVWTRKK